MADYTPRSGTPENHTFIAGALIAGGDVLTISAPNTVIPAGAALAPFAGVAAHDAVMGAAVTVHAGPGVVHETQSTAALVTAGDLLDTAIGGQVVSGAAPGAEIGVALTTTAAGGGLVRWKSTRG